MRSMRTKNLKTLVILLALLTAAPAMAQPSSRPGSRPGKSKPTVAKKTEKKADKDSSWLLIRNVDVFPVNGTIVRDGQILIRDDKIAAIGRDLETPDDCRVLDGDGMRAYPGLVALNGGGLVPSLRGGKGDNLDPKGTVIQLGLAHGITTVIAGTTAVKLDANATDDAILRSGLYTGMQYSRRNPGAKRSLREALRKALTYVRSSQSGMSDKEKKAAMKELGSASRYVPLLEGKRIAVFNVDNYQDILDACELTESFGFRAVFRGATEGWTVPGHMGRANVSVILTPRRRVDPKEGLNRETGSNMANASILYDHGVVVGIATGRNNFDYDGGPGRDALSVAWDAGAAVSGGLPESAALKAITLNAARIFRLDDRIGSLEVGKDADIVICDGEMLHYKTQVYYAVVNGKISYDRNKVTLYRHIRPRDPKLKKVEQWWPRPLAPMPESWRHDPAAADRKKEAEEARKKAEEAAKKGAAEKKKASPGKKGGKAGKKKSSPRTPPASRPASRK